MSAATQLCCGLAAAVALVTCIFVIHVLTDAGLRSGWDDHALTTDTVAGLLVLMITVLIVDQVIRLRQGNSKARTVAVPGAIKHGYLTSFLASFMTLLIDLNGPGMRGYDLLADFR